MTDVEYEELIAHLQKQIENLTAERDRLKEESTNSSIALSASNENNMALATENNDMKDESARILPIMQKSLPSLDDADALEVKDYFPIWEPDIAANEGYRFLYKSVLWKVRNGQSHTTQIGWEPDVASSLFECVKLPSEEGTHDNPISYALGMELIEGLYYTEDSILYLCTRSSEISLYNTLNTLIGLYVEVAN